MTSSYRNLILAVISILLISQFSVSMLLISDVANPIQAYTKEQKRISNSSTISNDQILPRTILLDPSVLADAREGLKQNNNSILQESLKDLLLEANSFLFKKPHSVTEKKQLPASGNKHDFLSLAPYMWPDPSKPNGLPYIGRDGEVNPEVDSIRDKKNMEHMIHRVKVLSLAYYFTDNASYSSKAEELLRAWFLSEKTHMNPNLKYAEMFRGKNNGSAQGIMAGNKLPEVIDAIGLIQNSLAWTKQDQKGIEIWFSKYLDWLLYSNQGKEEGQKINNHGTYYSVQVSSIALFLNKTAITKNVLQAIMQEPTSANLIHIQKQIAAKIQPDGRQPFELMRSNSLDYSMFNLLGLYKLASIGQRLDMDLWHFKTSQGAGLQTALDYLIPYALKKQNWPHPQKDQIDTNNLNDLLCQATLHYPTNEFYAKAYKTLKDVTTHSWMTNLVYMCS